MTSKSDEGRVRKAVRILDKLSRELGRLPSGDECIDRLRSNSMYTHVDTFPLKRIIDSWLRFKSQNSSLQMARQKHNLRRDKARLRAKLKALFQKPKGQFKRRISDVAKQSCSVNEFIFKLSKLPEFSEFISWDLAIFPRRELSAFLNEEKEREKLGKRKSEACQILNELSHGLNRTPSNDEFLARMRESSNMASLRAEGLRALVRHAMRKRKKRLRKKTMRLINKMARDSNRIPSVLECISQLREDAEYAEIDTQQLEQMAQNAVNMVSKKKIQKKQRKDGKKKGRRRRSHDAMNRAILSGFESNPRRH